MKRRQEPCPIVGCIDPKPRGKLMCRTHWRQVKAPLRQAVLSTWKAIQKTPAGERIPFIRKWWLAPNGGSA